MTRRTAVFAALLAALSAGALPAAYAADAKAAKKKSPAELEKEKALASPYPNDFGPESIDDEIKGYPAAHQEGYKLLKLRCTQCHNAARPLNSRFVEPADGLELAPEARAKKQEAAVAALKAEHPEFFKDQTVWQVEAGVWNRYVKRMLAKPGCGVDAGGKMTKAEAKKIYEFLVYDGQQRKIGANAEKWAAHRKKLVAELKEKNPKRYEELAKDKDL